MLVKMKEIKRIKYTTNTTNAFDKKIKLKIKAINKIKINHFCL